MTTRAAIYCRISKDRDLKKEGVERQEEDCRELAERLGWEVAAVYVDNDISAYSGKVRPQYRAMLEDVKAGRVEGVLAWHTDRLHRRPVELEEFITLAEERNLQVQTVKAGDLNLSTPSGRMVARMLGAAARGEVDHARDRMKRAKEDAATKGRYRGGRRPFGYGVDTGERRKGKIVWDVSQINEKEAEGLRLAVRGLRAGRSLQGVVNELNAEKIKTSTGREWTSQSLRPVLLRARNAGLIQKGRVWTRDPEILEGVKAAWPAIIEEEEWRAVHALLTDPSRLTPGAGASEPKWLGSGIYTCSLCQSVMRVTGVGDTPSRPGASRKYHYRCSETNHLTTAQVPTDDYVLKAVAEMVRDPRVVEAVTAGDGDAMQADREDRALLVTRLQQTEKAFLDDVIDARIYRIKVDKLNAELAEVEARLIEGVQQATVSPIFAAADPGAAFLAEPIDVQRAVLRSVLRVEIVQAPWRGVPFVLSQRKKGRVWKPERLRLTPVA